MKIKKNQMFGCLFCYPRCPCQVQTPNVALVSIIISQRIVFPLGRRLSMHIAHCDQFPESLKRHLITLYAHLCPYFRKFGPETAPQLVLQNWMYKKWTKKERENRVGTKDKQKKYVILLIRTAINYHIMLSYIAPVVWRWSPPKNFQNRNVRLFIRKWRIYIRWTVLEYM